MKNVVFLLEEQSAKNLLEGLLPKLLPEGVQAYFMVFQGKQDLEGQLVRKLRGWQRPDSVFVVLRDQDAGRCEDVKKRLVELSAQSGKKNVLVRVACRELESWMLGDLGALAKAFELGEGIVARGGKKPFRNPDQVVRPVEELRKLVPMYQKLDGARRVGPLLDPKSNASHSFRVFCKGVVGLAGKASF